MRITIRKQKEEETVNETQLIRRCQRGDRQAFETLIRQYYDYVSGFLLKATQYALLAQDLTQETFLKMIRSIETFDCNGAAGMGTWLVTIAKNCYVDYLRKNRIVLEDVDDLCAKCDSYAENWTPTAERLWACSHGCASCPSACGKEE